MSGTTSNSSLSVKSSTPPPDFRHVDDSDEPSSDLDAAGVAYVLGNLADWAARNVLSSGRGIDRDLVVADLDRVRRLLVAEDGAL